MAVILVPLLLMAVTAFPEPVVSIVVAEPLSSELTLLITASNAVWSAFRAIAASITACRSSSSASLSAISFNVSRASGAPPIRSAIALRNEPSTLDEPLMTFTTVSMASSLALARVTSDVRDASSAYWSWVCEVILPVSTPSTLILVSS